jgi:hypothetical protein
MSGYFNNMSEFKYFFYEEGTDEKISLRSGDEFIQDNPDDYQCWVPQVGDFVTFSRKSYEVVGVKTVRNFDASTLTCKILVRELPNRITDSNYDRY